MVNGVDEEVESKLKEVNVAMVKNYMMNEDGTKNKFDIEKDALGTKFMHK